jgi:hypothetical protein
VVLRTATTVNFNADWPGRYGRQGGAEAGTRTPRPAETLCCGRSPLRRFGCGRVGCDEPTLIGCLPGPREFVVRDAILAATLSLIAPQCFPSLRESR